MVTAATYHKQHVFSTPGELEYLHDLLLEKAEEHGWRLEAWAVLSNHYHFVGRSPEVENATGILTADLHLASANWINAKQGAPGRRVWYRHWHTLLTFEKSYLARLAYVHRNPVRHGLVKEAVDYRFCSARWLQQNSSNAFMNTLMTFPIDRVNVEDDF